MRILQLISTPLFLGAVAFAQQMGTPKEVTLNQLCGEFAFVTNKPVKREPNTYTTDEKPLKSVTLRLYKREDGTMCCEGLPSVEDVVTRRGGVFKFKNTTPGSYWLTTMVQGRHYEMPVNLQAPKPTGTACEDQLFQIDSVGAFTLAVKITVD